MRRGWHPLEAGPYDFQHARETHLIDTGKSLTGVAYLLGHTQVTTTNKHVKPSRRAVEEAVREALSGSRGSEKMCEGRELKTIANASDLSEKTEEKQASEAPPSRETSPTGDRPQEGSRPAVTASAEPLTLDLLRRKLDAAIVAEAWEAVKAIRERMIEVEREAMGNVIALRREGGVT